jgi:hypothetical protein
MHGTSHPLLPITLPVCCCMAAAAAHLVEGQDPVELCLIKTPPPVIKGYVLLSYKVYYTLLVLPLLTSSQ